MSGARDAMTIRETLLAQRVTLLFAGLIVLAGAGASSLFLFDSSSEVDQVPAGTDIVVHVDPTVAETETTRAVMNRLIYRSERHLGTAYSGPERYEPWLATTTIAGLNRTQLHGVTLFTTYAGVTTADGRGVTDLSNASYAGVVLESDWKTTDLVAAVANGTEYTTETYAGFAVYKPTATTGSEHWVGVLGDGNHVVGTPDAVTDALDVDRGAMQSVTGPLATAYRQTETGPTVAGRFAATFPTQEELIRAGGGNVTDREYALVESVRSISGSYAQTADTRIAMRVRMQTTSGSDAEDLQALTEAQVTKRRVNETRPQVVDFYRHLDVKRERHGVTVSVTRSPEPFTDDIEAVFGDSVLLFVSSLGDDPEINATAPAVQRQAEVPRTHPDR